MFKSALYAILVAAGLHGALAKDAMCKVRAADGCSALRQKYPNKTFYPGDEVYDYETQAFWSNTELMSPTCVFRPESSDDVAHLIILTAKATTEFAVRGGGHMSFKGANNIDDGVLVVLSNLTQIELSEDKSTVTLGPGHRWGAIYDYLRDYNLTVTGGRLSPIGVPGLLLAGGVNFYGNQYGWAADNVLSYDVVLANGTVVRSSDREHSDLFWALKGGSSNFGIVTSFTMRTIESAQVYAGTYAVSSDHVNEFMALTKQRAVANFSALNSDPKAHAIPQAIVESENSTYAAVMLLYDSTTESSPECFAPFFDIPATSNSFALKTVADFAAEAASLVTDDISDLLIAGTVVGADYDTLLRGIQITYDVFFGALPALYAAIPFANLSLVSLVWQAIGPLWQAASMSANPTGNALGVDPASKGTYLCWVEMVEWTGDGYEDVVNAWVENTTALINNATQAAGIYDAFNYMGDAAGFQNIYAGYGPENEARLLEISRKYDPGRVFQNRLPGGFKIGE